MVLSECGSNLIEVILELASSVNSRQNKNVTFWFSSLWVSSFLRKFNWLRNYRYTLQIIMSKTSDLDTERLFRIRYQDPDPTGSGSTARVGTCLGLPDWPPTPLIPTAVEGGLFSLLTIVQHKHTCLPPLCPSAQEETETGEKMRLSAQCRTCHPDCVSCFVSFPTCCSLNVIQMSLLNKKYSNPWKKHVFFCVYRICGGRHQCSRAGGLQILIYGSAVSLL